MIKEIEVIKSHPDERSFLVADSMLGQESVNVAKTFNEAVGLTGIVLTKLTAMQGGAALSMKYVTESPLSLWAQAEKPRV